MLTELLFIPLGFFAGALPLSLWIGRLAGVDIRTVGDGNPGATNVFRAAGWRWGVAALCADISKAAVPVGLAYFVFDWRSWIMLPIALAPSFGHASGLFSDGRGGKALATMLGCWIGLTLTEMPLVFLPALVLFTLLLRGDGWSVLLAAGVSFIYLFLFQPNPLFIAVLAGHTAVVLWTHWADFHSLPRLRSRWRRRLTDSS